MWLFFTTLGSFSKMSDTTMLDLSGDHKPLCQRVFSVQSSIDIMGRCYSSTMNRWKFMFHKIMLHSVPTNFRDNSSILVIFSRFALAPFFLRIWYKIALCEWICKMINVWIYLVELWLRNVVTFLWISVSTEKAASQCYQLNLSVIKLLRKL